MKNIFDAPANKTSSAAITDVVNKTVKPVILFQPPATILNEKNFALYTFNFWLMDSFSAVRYI